MNGAGDYEDIIDMPRHISSKHPQMSVYDRAAQFAPFAALTGYEELIEEAGAANAAKRDSVYGTDDDLYIP